MHIHIHRTPSELGKAAGKFAIEKIQELLESQENLSLILATGTSQFETLACLTDSHDVDWKRIRVFHLDEYMGIKADHPASFRNYLQKRVHQKLPKIQAFHYIKGDAINPLDECHRLEKLLQQYPVDLALIGIGENGHLAFNDPPADFETEEPFIIVELDEACRRQQLGEGWFPTLGDVPKQAISMSIRQIMKSATLLVSVPDLRKANAVRNALKGKLNPPIPPPSFSNILTATCFWTHNLLPCYESPRPHYRHRIFCGHYRLWSLDLSEDPI